MSTKVETLQARRAGGSILLAAFLVSLVVLTTAAVAISFDSDQGRQGETTFVGRQVVSTPSEQNAGIVGGTAANTPSELNAQIGGGRPKTVAGGTLANTPSELFGSRGDPAAARQKYVSDKLGTNTPSELGAIYARHQRR